MKPRQKWDRKQARLDFDRPIGLFSSLKMELSVLIVIATSIAFVLVWFLLKYGWSGWIDHAADHDRRTGHHLFLLTGSDRATEAAA